MSQITNRQSYYSLNNEAVTIHPSGPIQKLTLANEVVKYGGFLTVVEAPSVTRGYLLNAPAAGDSLEPGQLKKVSCRDVGTAGVATITPNASTVVVYANDPTTQDLKKVSLFSLKDEGQFFVLKYLHKTEGKYYFRLLEHGDTKTGDILNAGDQYTLASL